MAAFDFAALQSLFCDRQGVGEDVAALKTAEAVQAIAAD